MGAAASSAGRSGCMSISLAARYAASQGNPAAQMRGKTFTEAVQSLSGNSVMHYSTLPSPVTAPSQQHVSVEVHSSMSQGNLASQMTGKTFTEAVRSLSGNSVMHYSTLPSPVTAPSQQQASVKPRVRMPAMVRPQYNFPVANIAMFRKVDGVKFGPSSRPCDLYLKFDPIIYARCNPMMRQRVVKGSFTKSNEKMKIWVVEEFTKTLERDLVLLVITQHKIGRCFSDLKMSDLYICGDGMFALKDGVDFDKLTPEGIDRDFANAAAILETLLTECAKRVGGQLPIDHAHLFRLMKMSASKHVYLIATHTSMLPMSTRSEALRKFHGEILRVLPDGVMRGRILSKITINKSWESEVNKNYHLRGCKIHRQLHHPDSPYVYQSPAHLLDLHRNFDAHRYQHCRSLAEGESDLIQYAHFPLMLPEIQAALWDENHIHHLHIEELFTDGKSAIVLTKAATP